MTCRGDSLSIAETSGGSSSNYQKTMSGYSVDDLLEGLEAIANIPGSNALIDNQTDILAILQLLNNSIADIIENNSGLLQDTAATIFQSALDSKRLFLGVFAYLMKLCSSNADADRSLYDCINVAISILVNITIVEVYAVNLVQYISDGTIPLSSFETVINKYLDYNVQLNESNNINVYDPFNQIGNLLCNICRIEDGRKLILLQSKGYVPKLLAQFNSTNSNRQRGSIATVRTCLFDKDIHWWILNEIKALTFILLPLSSPISLTDSERDGMDPLLWMKSENLVESNTTIKIVDIDTYKMLLECILLLCQVRSSREYLRKCKTYPIIRNFDYSLPSNADKKDDGDNGNKQSSNEETKSEYDVLSDVIYEIVQFLMRDEETKQQELSVS